MKKLELVRQAEAQFAVVFALIPFVHDLRGWQWRVGVVQRDVISQGELAFVKGEEVVFRVVESARDFPVEAYSYKALSTRGLAFNDVRELEPSDNTDLTNIDFSQLPALPPEDLLWHLNRSIYADALLAAKMYWSHSDEGIVLKEKNVPLLLKAALRPKSVSGDTVVFVYEGEPLPPNAPGEHQTIKVRDLADAKDLDGLNWQLKDGTIVQFK